MPKDGMRTRATAWVRNTFVQIKSYCPIAIDKTLKFNYIIIVTARLSFHDASLWGVQPYLVNMMTLPLEEILKVLLKQNWTLINRQLPNILCGHWYKSTYELLTK